jgi:hypothetical protein
MVLSVSEHEDSTARRINQATRFTPDRMAEHKPLEGLFAFQNLDDLKLRCSGAIAFPPGCDDRSLNEKLCMNCLFGRA